MNAAATVATIFGLGRLRPAPGTWASAATIALACLLHLLGGFPLVLLATLAATALGFWACAGTISRPDEDPAEVVIDEVAGQMIAFAAVSYGLWHAGVATIPWPAWLVPFLLFRLFDIWKPGPVGWADRRGGATGVMLDDIIAGGLAALVSVLLAGLYHGVIQPWLG